MDLGNEFTYWGIKNPKKNPCAAQEDASYNTMMKRFFTGRDSGQIREGLDTFYNEPLNRPILISDGVWIVLEKLSGLPSDQWDKMVSNFRENAPLTRRTPL